MSMDDGNADNMN